MTYLVGDGQHITAGHNAFAVALNTELARFGLTPDSVTAHNPGDPDHILVHNELVASLAAIATAAGQTYTTALPPMRHIGDAGHTDDHNLMEAALVEAATWPAWNDATGGTIAEVDNYNGTGERWRVHRFTGNGTLNVSLAVQPFRVLVVGGGGGGGAGGGAQHGGGGDGGWGSDTTTALTTGAHTITVGGGGGGAGGASTAFGITGNGGKAGAYQGGGDTHGATNGPNSDTHGAPFGAISTVPFRFGAQGLGFHGWRGNNGPPNTGRGGDGGNNTGSPGPTGGGSGVVIVAYQIG